MKFAISQRNKPNLEHKEVVAFTELQSVCSETTNICVAKFFIRSFLHS